MFEFDTELLLV